ncbi:FAD-binding and (Fe-S)-binding domain-containing protein [Halorientalis halophila]|uniref:FAD-binding and (Fe-S)-binding domain-containing protein n=1 Tax=Halorientalis halophila TaxID=3108499 RepID=UPI003009B78B
MGTNHQNPIERPADPPGDPSDLAREPDVAEDEYVELAEALDEALSGDVRFDEYAQVLYATDGSIYQARPAGVVYPRDIADVRAAVQTAVEHEVPILPRGAGSSLAGQTVGPGCVVLDMSRHMDGLLEVDPDEQWARIQPGIVQDDLEDELTEHGLKFAPDPASSGRATVGGGIGNNSTGAHSVRYGITDAYTEEVKAVLPDGSMLHAREIVLDSEEYEQIVSRDDREAEIYRTVRAAVEDNQEEIDSRYPELKRRVSGYNLDRLIYENEDGQEVINLAKLYVGSEGTLGVIVEAKVGLVTVPEETALALYCFEDLVDAMSAVPEALEFEVSAVELMDDEVFRLAAESDGYSEYVEPIPEGTAAALMLEFDSELVDDFEGAIAETNDYFVDNGDAFDVIEAYTDEDQADIWKLRKAAIPLLMSLQGDPKPYPFIEDATVPPEELAEYVVEFEEVLEDHDTSAAYFAHAGSGTLHIRPILNLKTENDIEKMHSITEDVTDLVLDHHGAFSGEHGDGMARTEFNPKMYGEDLWTAFKEVKTAFDPDWYMHPGNVVYRKSPSDPGPDSDRGVGADMRENLRYGAQYQSLEPQTKLDFDDEGGFSHLVELCNGCGTCRETGSDVMCPTFRASREEIQATRGRANMLRAAISGELPEEEIYSDRFQSEVLDLCVGCKGCKSDCPTGVDLAKLKAEVKHDYHQEKGTSIRSRLFGNIDTVSAIGSKLAPLSNAAQNLPGSGLVAEKVMGIAPERDLPKFSGETLEDWFAARGGAQVPMDEAEDTVLLFPDTFTNYSYTEPGKAAIEVLEAADVHVQVLDSDEIAPSGRAAFSMGLLDEAHDRARTNLEALGPMVEDGWSVLFIEPSDAVMFQDEYLDLLDDDRVEDLAVSAYGVSEYLHTFAVYDRMTFDGASDHLVYHGHCNQKALNRDFHAAAALREAGYEVDHLDSSCCGMAGSFGYEAEHYELSKAIGEILYDQIESSDGDTVVAPGASCRSQLSDEDFEGEHPPHPVEKVRDALA